MPRCKQSEIQIVRWDVDETTKVEYLPMDDSLFSALWDAGLFAAINVACDTQIADYESEWIQNDLLPTVKHAIMKFRSDPQTNDVNDFVDSLLAIIEHATETKNPIYFEC